MAALPDKRAQAVPEQRKPIILTPTLLQIKPEHLTLLDNPNPSKTADRHRLLAKAKREDKGKALLHQAVTHKR